MAATSCGGHAGPRHQAQATTTATPPVSQASVGGYGPPVRLGDVVDPDVDESSGLVASRRNPGLYWTHNDSGDGPFIYCLRAHGESCGAWSVTGADAFDWEDIAAGPGPDAATPYLYIGDIGDNLSDRSSVVVYRVAEPAVPPTGTAPPKSAPGVTAPAQALRLRYPDGPHDAEALLVHPQTGDVYIVVKETNPGVYRARAPISTTSTTTMTKVANLSVGQSGNPFTDVTGGDIAPDGSRLALCTYVDGYELRLRPGQAFDDIWTVQPVRLALGARPQGESIAYSLDGTALLTTSERPAGLPDPFWEIDRQ